MDDKLRRLPWRPLARKRVKERNGKGDNFFGRKTMLRHVSVSLSPSVSSCGGQKYIFSLSLTLMTVTVKRYALGSYYCNNCGIVDGIIILNRI